MSDTIFALASGAPPCAIAVIRVSGPGALAVADRLAGKPIVPRRATLANLRTEGAEILDQAIVIAFPGPGSATGEDCVEFHCHGSRAVVQAVESTLANFQDLRPAEPGEFTRRAFANDRLDLAEVEGLGQLLRAETELQRRVALGTLGGALSRRIAEFRQRLLGISAMVEGLLDHADEEDVAESPASVSGAIKDLQSDLEAMAAQPLIERLGEGYRVALAGPPNAGKSTLFNALIENEAAIATPIEGTTRDVLERSVQLGGMPFTFVDMAGLRDRTDDAIESIGIARARSELGKADCVLWLGAFGEGPPDAVEVATKSDIGPSAKPDSAFSVSGITWDGVEELRAGLVERARRALPSPSEASLNARQQKLVVAAAAHLHRARDTDDPILVAEELRSARRNFDAITGSTGTEDMLDSLFGSFCIGK